MIVQLQTLPTDFANLAAWYRYNHGIEAVSNLVSRWRDQSGNGRDLLQATATNQPTLISDGSILFDGVDNYMAATFTLNVPYSICILFKQVGWANAAHIFDGTTTNSFVLQQITASPQLRLADSALGTSTTSDLSVDTYGVVFASQSGTTGTLVVNNGSAVTGTLLGTNMGGFTLGTNAGGGDPANIQVKEVLIYSAALDASTRAQLVNYLTHVNGTFATKQSFAPSYMRRGRR